MRILFVASEGLPFAKTGGLADVIEGLPKALAQLGHDVAVVLPCYRGLEAGKAVLPSLTVPLGPETRFVAVRGGFARRRVRYYFVDDPEYFAREHLYGDRAGDYPDNAERFAAFSRAAIETAKLLFRAEVIHCHDWQAALLPVLLRTVYAADPAFAEVPTVLTVHNLGYPGLFPRETLERVGLPKKLFAMDGLEYYGKVNYLKGGMLFADYLTTVSRRYAEEIQTSECGYGLEGVVRARAGRVVGILNGVDYTAWDPRRDRLIAARYSAANLAGKQRCKKDLLDQMGLPEANLDRPVVGIVSRFVDQKGFDLIAEVADEMLEENLALVALGTGLAPYEELFRKLAARWPERVGVRIGYDNVLAHKIEAGADIFLMPSRYEPCGLNQIFSLRYGTVPVVRATGGLDDTIEPFDPVSGQGTGFKFSAYTGEAMLDSLRRALAAYRDRDAWRRLQLNGMAKDFSWKASAEEYARLYAAAREARIGVPAAASN
jgi:starch synthase